MMRCSFVYIIGGGGVVLLSGTSSAGCGALFAVRYSDTVF